MNAPAIDRSGSKIKVMGRSEYPVDGLDLETDWRGQL